MKSFRLFSVVLFVFAFSGLYSQNNYKSAVGFKGGNNVAASYKLSASSEAYLEFTGGLTLDEIGGGYIMVYFEKHKYLATNGLSWYAGPGIGSTLGGNNRFAASGIVGLDFGFDEIPFNISLDFSPLFVFGGSNNFVPLWTGSIRYIIN